MAQLLLLIMSIFCGLLGAALQNKKVKL
jgi:hypothetical protein